MNPEMCSLPDGDHVVVHLLQLLLGDLNLGGGRLELVRLERLWQELDGEGLLIFLRMFSITE